ncbi:MAG: superoxide dismutase family protein [Firmicutes bacterium]|nr:superoxide dismutase family protein [Bacillota bacterium]
MNNYSIPPINHQPGMIAFAQMQGGPLAPWISGTVWFCDMPGGVEVSAVIYGLPPYRPAVGTEAPVGPHGFHIHQFGNCEAGDPNNPFTAAGEHWNQANQPHGNHAGDFPVLFSNNGFARISFYTNKFRVADITGKSVIIHQNPDDYRTQPAGAAGKRLACGVIRFYGWQ